MYLTTASTVLGLVFVLAILLRAVLVLAILLSAVLVRAILLSAVLVLVLDCQSNWTWQVLSQVLFMFSLNIWLYFKNWEKLPCVYCYAFFLTKCHDIKQMVLVLKLNILRFYEYITSTPEYFLNICCENLFLFVVNKMKLS